ncbi:cyclase family protein [Candidatus Neomarinimicrobiota bacterium]
MRGAIWLNHPLNEDTPVYGGGEGLGIHSQSSISSGDTANTSRWEFPNHLGTHLDAPYHFFDQGAKLSDYPPDYWIFSQPLLLDVPAGDGHLITPEDVTDRLATKPDLLILRTGYERYRQEERYWQRNPGLSSELGFWLRKNYPSVRAVGLDCISITSRLHRETGRAAHQAFLDPEGPGNPIPLIEDMALISASSDLKQIIVAPFPVAEADGGPCTILGLY